jgi:hypothetical protein
VPDNSSNFVGFPANEVFFFYPLQTRLVLLLIAIDGQTLLTGNFKTLSIPHGMLFA